MVLPPLPPGSKIELDLRPADGPAPLQLTVNQRIAAELAGDSARTRLWLEPDQLEHGSTTTIGFERSASYPPGNNDSRPLSVQVYSIRAIGSGLPWAGGVASGEERQRLDVGIEGAYPPEQLGSYGRACWLRPEAGLRPAGPYAGDSAGLACHC